MQYVVKLAFSCLLPPECVRMLVQRSTTSLFIGLIINENRRPFQRCGEKKTWIRSAKSKMNGGERERTLKRAW